MRRSDTDGVRALMPGWSTLEDRAWRGDPSPTTAWLEAAVRYGRGGCFLPLGDTATPSSPP